jgi:putative lipoprotein
MVRLFGVFAMLVALAACSGDGETRSATVVGEVTYRERMALPPDAQLHVTLRVSDGFVGKPASSPDGGRVAAAGRAVSYQPGDIVARHSGTLSGSAPFPFTLRYDPDALDPFRILIIEAWIGAGEQVLFASAETARIQVGSPAPVRLTLRRPRRINLTCTDGSSPTAAFSTMGELAFLEISGAPPIALRALPTGSGFRYGGAGYNLRGRGTEVTLQRPMGGETRCEPQRPSQPSQIRFSR